MKRLKAHEDMYVIINNAQVRYITRNKTYTIINCLFDNNGWIIIDDIGQQSILMNDGFMKYFTVLD